MTELTDFDTRLAELEPLLAAWYERFHAEANELFQASSYTADTFLEKGREAGRIAREHVGEGPWNEVYELLDEICSAYIRLNRQQCAQLRAIVKQYRSFVYALLGDYEDRAITLLESTHESQWVWRCLAAVSIENNAMDFRDTYMVLGRLYLTAFHLGIDSIPAFSAIGKLSATDVHGSTSPTPMRRFLADFDRSSYFYADVRPHLQAVQRKQAKRGRPWWAIWRRR